MNFLNKFFKKKRKSFIFEDNLGMSYNEKPKDIVKNNEYNTSLTIKCLNKGKLVTNITTTHNTTVYPGRLNMQYIFGYIPNPNQHLTLNHMLEIPHSSNVFEEGSNKFKLRSIEYFCIGNGAENTTVRDDIISARSSDCKLYNMVPFRCLPLGSDLSDNERINYKLRKIIQIEGRQYVAYYAKKLTSEILSVTYNGEDYFPKETDTSALPDTNSAKPLKTGEVRISTVMTLKIDDEDFKEYYKILKNDSLQGAGLNEFGLIYALPAPNLLENSREELAGAELYSKITFATLRYETPGSETEFKYLINT